VLLYPTHQCASKKLKTKYTDERRFIFVIFLVLHAT
jgi:hypothetical protein